MSPGTKLKFSRNGKLKVLLTTLILLVLAVSDLLAMACSSQEAPNKLRFMKKHKRSALASASFHEDYEENVGYKFKSESSSPRTKSGSSLKENADDLGLRTIGCFDSWTNNARPSSYFVNSEFDENHTVGSCKAICQRKELQVLLLKGGECICMPVSDFTLFKISSDHCNIICPVSTLMSGTPVASEGDLYCGGNTAYSVYCLKDGPEDCTLLEESPIIPVEPQSRNILSALPLYDCAQCSGNCFSTGISIHYDYFPRNEPESCAKFCAVEKKYARTTGSGDNHELEIITRPPTKHAVLLWDRGIIPFGRSICHCVDDADGYNFVGRAFCDTPCPGNNSVPCGSSTARPDIIIVQIYCTQSMGLDNKCTMTDDNEPPSPSTPELTTESDTTTTKSTLPQSPPVQSTTPTIPDQTKPVVTESTTSETPTTSTTISTTTTTTTEDPEETTTSDNFEITTTEEATTVSSTTSTRQPITNCQIKCEGVEFNERFWSVCAGSIGVKDCGHQNTDGHAIWSCSEDGQFQTKQPDYSGCHSKTVEELEKESHAINDTESALNYLDKLKNGLKDPNHYVYFGHEIHNMTKILGNVVEGVSKGSSAKEFEKVAEHTIGITDHVITTAEPWHQLSDRSRSELSSNLILMIEETSIHLTSKIVLSSESPLYEKPLWLQSKYLVIAGVESKQFGVLNSSLVFPSQSHRERDSFIRLPEGWKNTMPGDNVEFVGMSINSEYAHLMMPGQFKSLGVSETDKTITVSKNDKVINGKLMSLSLASDGNQVGRNIHLLNEYDSKKISVVFKGRGVQITFKHDLEAWGENPLQLQRKLHAGETPKAALGTAQCVFWDTQHLIWSPNGCKMVASSRYQTVCECNHLTSFAVLMDVHNYTGKDIGLEILTLLLCSISFLCLFISIVIFSTYRGIQSEITSITKNLSICLLIGNTLVMLVVDRNYFNMTEGFCVASGIVTHYIFLAAFSWMAIEGVHLYRMVVHVFDSENNPLNLYRVISYGAPLLVVVVTVMIGYLKGDKPYGGDVICWLQGNYIWSFMVPVLAIVLENFIILFIALKTAYQLQNNPKRKMPHVQNRVRSFRTWIKGCFSVTVLLGLTWLVGFFTLIPSVPGMVAAYLFVILNASQGIFIFLFHCLFNDKIRFVTYQRFGTYLPTWISSSLHSSSEQSNNRGGSRTRSNMKKSTSDSSISRQNKISTDPRPDPLNLEYDRVVRNGIPDVKRKSSEDEKVGGEISMICPQQMMIRRGSLLRKRDSFGTLSSIDSLRGISTGSISDGGSTTDNSMKFLVGGGNKGRSAQC